MLKTTQGATTIAASAMALNRTISTAPASANGIEEPVQCAEPGLAREQFHTACATTFPGRPATAGLVLAIDAGCGLSIRGHWDCPVICNEAGRAFRAFFVQHGERWHLKLRARHKQQ